MGDDETEATTLPTSCMVIMERMDGCSFNVMDERSNFHQRNSEIVLMSVHLKADCTFNN